MPVGFNSPARNLFLLGSSGAQVVTNFFKTIDQSAGTDQLYLPDEIKYNDVDQKFVLAGSASDSQVKGFGWLEKRQEDGTQDWGVRVESTQVGVNTKLRALHLDSNDNLIVVGGVGDIPWIAKYSNGGVIDWQSTTNSANVEYTGVTSDSNGNYYACGLTPSSGDAQAFVEKFDANGNPGWGKSAFMLGRDVVLEKIAANDRGEVVAVGLLQDDEAYKGYIVKIDTNTGEVLWDRTLRSYEDNVTFGYTPVFCEDVFIDSKDQIYIVGRYFGISESRGFIVKYTAEGNMIWQKETPVGENIEYYEVKSDGETEQTIVFGRYRDSATNDLGGILSKYSKNGNLVWRRTLFSSYNNSDTFGEAGGRGICLDADPSFYYLLYFDDAIDALNGTPLGYTFGKVSSSGNGLGGFEYTEGTGETLYYDILNVQDKIGRLSDGSVRNDTSDNLVYPFTANKLVFDDLATQVSNKKRQMDSAGSFEYSGSPAVRPPDFAEFSFGYSQSGRDWYDLSGNNRNGKTVITEPYLGWGSVSFDGSGDSLSVGPLLPTSTGTAFTVDMYWYSTSNTVQTCLWEQHNSGSGRTAYFINGTNAFLISEGNTVGSFAYSNNRWYFTRVTYTAGGTIEVFVDGVSQGTGTQTVGVDNVNFVIGDRSGEANEAFNGYISNCRVVVGSALNGTEVPTEPLTRVPGTKLLTCQGDTISDGGEDVLSININGNAAVTADGATWNSSGWWEFQTQPGASAPYPGTAIDLPRDYSPDLLASGFTASWWQRGTTTAGQAAQFVAVQGLMQIGNSDLQQSWRVERNNSAPNTIEFGVMDGTTFSNNELISSNFPDGEWIHVTIKWDGTKQYIYKNGTLDAQRTFVGTPTHQVGGTVRIGSRQIGAPYAYNGDIAEFRLWDRSLTATQIFQDYNATKSKYINEAPDTAPKISSDAIVYDNNLLLNYDFGNRATYDTAHNLYDNSTNYGSSNWNLQGANGVTTNTTDVLSPVGDYTATKWQPTTTTTQYIYDGIGAMGTETHTMSVWVRAADGETTTFGMNLYAPTQQPSDFTATDKWQRFAWTFAPQNQSTAYPVIVRELDKALYIWGPQIEKASTAGNYVSTYSTSVGLPTTVKNLSSSSYIGTLNGGSTFINAGYFDFDGVNGYIDTGYNPGAVTALTVEAWLRVDTYTNDGAGISIGTNQAGTGQCYLGRGNSGGDSMDWRFYTGTFLDETEFFTSDTGWKHYVGTYDQTGGAGSNQGRMRLYVDGNLEDTALSNNTSAIDFSSGENIRIGVNTNGSSYFDGKFGEVRVYNRALTATEVSQNYNATRGKYGV